MRKDILLANLKEEALDCYADPGYSTFHCFGKTEDEIVDAIIKCFSERNEEDFNNLSVINDSEISFTIWDSQDIERYASRLSAELDCYVSAIYEWSFYSACIMKSGQKATLENDFYIKKCSIEDEPQNNIVEFLFMAHHKETDENLLTIDASCWDKEDIGEFIYSIMTADNENRCQTIMSDNTKNEVILQVAEPHIIEKIHQLRQDGYSRIWTGNGQICYRKN